MPAYYNGPNQYGYPITPPSDDFFLGPSLPIVQDPAPTYINGTRYAVDSLDKYAYVKQPQQVPSWNNPSYGKTDVNTWAYPSSDSVYGQSRKPTLPPPYLPMQRSYNDVLMPPIQSVLPAPQPKAQEEKVTGGVSAKLDYVMDVIVDFVSTQAREILGTRSSSKTEFRKYVSQVLVSTRLPSSTILLALHYLNVRVQALNQQLKDHSSNTDLYNLTTAALMIASKFLDDNTFQNKSWAEVSRIPVAELTSLEMHWLVDMDWNLHVDPHQFTGFSDWQTRWQDFQQQCQNKYGNALRVQTSSAPRQPVSSYNYTPPTPEYTPVSSERNFPTSYVPSQSQNTQQSAPAWPQWNSQMQMPLPALQPCNSWSPEFQTSLPPIQSFASTQSRNMWQPQPFSREPLYSPSSATTYNGYSSSVWSNHFNGCTCARCAMGGPSYKRLGNFTYGSAIPAI